MAAYFFWEFLALQKLNRSLRVVCSSLTVLLALSANAFANRVSESAWHSLHRVVLGIKTGSCEASLGADNTLALASPTSEDYSNAVSAWISNRASAAPRLTNHDGTAGNLVTNGLLLQYGSKILRFGTETVAGSGNKAIIERIANAWISQARLQAVDDINALNLTGKIPYSAGLRFPILPRTKDGRYVWPTIGRRLAEASIGAAIYTGKPLIGPLLTAEENKLFFRDEEGGRIPVRNAKEFEAKLIQDVVHRLMKAAQQETRKRSAIAIDNFDSAVVSAAEKLRHHDPLNPYLPGELSSWNDYFSIEGNLAAAEWRHAVIEPLETFLKQLREFYPLGAEREKYALTRMESVDSTDVISLLSETLLPDSMAAIIRNAGVRAEYSTKLATTVLGPMAGPWYDKKGPILLLAHGEGTNKSHVGSWTALLPTYRAQGYSSVGIDMPLAGQGIDMPSFGVESQGRFARTPLSRLGLVARYIDQTLRTLHEESIAKGDLPSTIPLNYLGRSLGSTRGFIHALLHQSTVDFYTLMSLTVPDTLEMQTANIYEQLKKGDISVIMRESLENGKGLAKELVALLEDMKANDPHVFENFGHNMVFLQGDSDADGGPTVLEDVRGFVAKYCPEAEVFSFHNRLLKHKEILAGRQINGDLVEGSHFIANNDANVTIEDVRKGKHPEFEGVPDEDLPKFRDQTIEMDAIMWGQMDYFADGPDGHGLPWPRPDDRIRQLKAQATREAKGLPAMGGKTLQQWYAESRKIPEAEIVSAEPGYYSLPQRLKRVRLQWEAKRVKMAEKMKAQGLL